MTGWFEQFLIKLFIALGEYLFSKGSKYFKQWQDFKENSKLAEKYQGVVDNPDSTREDRRKIEDDLLG